MERHKLENQNGKNHACVIEKKITSSQSWLMQNIQFINTCTHTMTLNMYDFFSSQMIFEFTTIVRFQK